MPNVGRSSAADMRTVMPLSAVSLSHSRRIAATSDPSPSAVGVSPATITRASARFSRAVVWINSRYLGLADTSLSDLWGLAGLDADSTLSQTATNRGLGDLPIANLYWLIGITDDDTLQQTVNALGIGDTPLDTLLQDWGVGDQHIGGYLSQLSVSPQELFNIFGIDPSSLPRIIWDPATGSFTAGATVANSMNATAEATPRFHHLKPSSYIRYSTLTVLCSG